jgi:hypothetical protein
MLDALLLRRFLTAAEGDLRARAPTAATTALLQGMAVWGLLGGAGPGLQGVEDAMAAAAEAAAATAAAPTPLCLQGAVVHALTTWPKAAGLQAAGLGLLAGWLHLGAPPGADRGTMADVSVTALGRHAQDPTVTVPAARLLAAVAPAAEGLSAQDVAVACGGLVNAAGAAPDTRPGSCGLLSAAAEGLVGQGPGVVDVVEAVAAALASLLAGAWGLAADAPADTKAVWVRGVTALGSACAAVVAAGKSVPVLAWPAAAAGLHAPCDDPHVVNAALAVAAVAAGPAVNVGVMWAAAVRAGKPSNTWSALAAAVPHWRGHAALVEAAAEATTAVFANYAAALAATQVMTAVLEDPGHGGSAVAALVRRPEVFRRLHAMVFPLSALTPAMAPLLGQVLRVLAGAGVGAAAGPWVWAHCVKPVWTSPWTAALLEDVQGATWQATAALFGSVARRGSLGASSDETTDMVVTALDVLHAAAGCNDAAGAGPGLKTLLQAVTVLLPDAHGHAADKWLAGACTAADPGTPTQAAIVRRLRLALKPAGVGSSATKRDPTLAAGSPHLRRLRPVPRGGL